MIQNKIRPQIIILVPISERSTFDRSVLSPLIEKGHDVFLAESIPKGMKPKTLKVHGEMLTELVYN